MGKIYLNGVDYSAPVGGGGGDTTGLEKRVAALEEKTENIGSGVKISNSTRIVSNHVPEVNIGDSHVTVGARGGAVFRAERPTQTTEYGTIMVGYMQDNGGMKAKKKLFLGGKNEDYEEIYLPFSFGVDENGNYGYIEAGADTVIPFRQSINYDVLPDTANAIGGGTDILINIPIIRGIDIQRTAVINDNDAIYTLFLLLNKNIDKYYPISEYPNLSVYYSSPSYIVSQEHPTLYASFPIRSLTNVDDLLQYIPDGDNVNKIKTLIDFFDIRYFTFSKGNNFMDNSAFYMSVISPPSSYNAEYRYKASTLVIQFLQPNNDLIISTL